PSFDYRPSRCRGGSRFRPTHRRGRERSGSHHPGLRRASRPRLAQDHVALPPRRGIRHQAGRPRRFDGRSPPRPAGPPEIRSREPHQPDHAAGHRRAQAPRHLSV
ncbi:uncharacterized protein METZ01_LOCUS388113, partial [marine metagenome]